MDSNQKHINFLKLFGKHKTKVWTRRIYTLKQALDWFDTTEQQPRVGPTDIVIHLGTNNIDRCSPEQIVSMINELIEAASQSFPQAKVHVSELLPRKSAEFNRKVEETNKRLWSQT